MHNVFQTEEAVEARRLVADALTELNRAVHKIGMYPAEHPLVPAAIQAVQRAVGAALSTVSKIRLGVAREKILFEGEPLEEKSPALRWIARTLHGGGVGVLELSPRVSFEELHFLVSWLYRARRADGAANGEELAAAKLQGMVVDLLDYGRLAFGQGREEDAAKVWETLASALLHELPRGGAFLSSEEVPALRVGRGGFRAGVAGVSLGLTPESLAQQLDSSLRAAGAEGEDRIASRLIEVGRRLPQMQPSVREEVKGRLASLITHLSPQLQRHLLGLTSSRREEKAEFVSEMADVLPEPLVLEVLSDVERAGEKVPRQFMTLLSKLGGLARRQEGSDQPDPLRPSGTPEGEQMRDILRDVFTDRVEKDPNPAAYQKLLERISRDEGTAAAPISIKSRYRDPRDPEDLRAGAAGIAARLLLDNAGGGEVPALLGYVAGAAMELLRGGRLSELSDGVAAARHVLASGLSDEGARKTAETLLTQISRPDVIDLLMEASERPGEPGLALASLFRATEADGVVRALFMLPTLPPGPGRERRVQLLAAAGPEALVSGFDKILEEGVEALRGAIPMLRRIGQAEAIAIARKLGSHEDPGVRIEAYRTLAYVDRREGAFDRYLEGALWDSDSRVGAFVLGLLKGRAGEAACALLSRYIAGEFGLADPELHLRAIAVLAENPSAAARDALIRVLHSGRLSFRSADLGVRVAAERALLLRRDPVSRRALSRWQRSPVYWASLLVVRRSA